MIRIKSCIIPLAMIIFCIASCGDSERAGLEKLQIDEVCSKVNRDNWWTPVWNQRSPEDVCREQNVNITDGQIPCTFGGLPGWCRVQSDGYVAFHRGISPTWLDIYAAERELAAPHLVLIQ